MRFFIRTLSPIKLIGACPAKVTLHRGKKAGKIKRSKARISRHLGEGNNWMERSNSPSKWVSESPHFHPWQSGERERNLVASTCKCNKDILGALHLYWPIENLAHFVARRSSEKMGRKRRKTFGCIKSLSSLNSSGLSPQFPLGFQRALSQLRVKKDAVVLQNILMIFS